LALDIRDQDQDIWVWNLAGHTLTRLTFDPGTDQYPVWSRDGRTIVFGSPREGSVSLYRQSADGSSAAERLTEAVGEQLSYAMTPDGTALVFRQITPQGSSLSMLALDGGGRTTTLLEERFELRNADISPDGRWLAYQSNETERTEVYVRPLSNPDSARWQISTGGGIQPLWSRDGRELFYLDLEGVLMGVPVQLSAAAFSGGSPTRLLERAYFANFLAGRNYDVSPDGRRFLMIKEGEDDAATATTSDLVVVQNWFEELTRLAP
jgi:serine/threonine-protein kinase